MDQLSEPDVIAILVPEHQVQGDELPQFFFNPDPCDILRLLTLDVSLYRPVEKKDRDQENQSVYSGSRVHSYQRVSGCIYTLPATLSREDAR